MRRIAKDESEMPGPDLIGSMSGLDFMRGILRGELPGAPMAGTLDYNLVTVEEGFVVAAGRPRFDFHNPIGSVHGGWFGTLLDTCMGCAVQTMLPKGRGYVTLEYKINILRAATARSGLIRAEGRAVHVGRRTATAEGRMIGEDGKLYATGTTTCLVLEL